MTTMIQMQASVKFRVKENASLPLTFFKKLSNSKCSQPGDFETTTLTGNDVKQQKCCTIWYKHSQNIIALFFVYVNDWCSLAIFNVFASSLFYFCSYIAVSVYRKHHNLDFSFVVMERFILWEEKQIKPYFPNVWGIICEDRTVRGVPNIQLFNE